MVQEKANEDPRHTHAAEPPRMLEAIIRSFPGRVLTVTVLAPHKSGQKRALSFDSCLPPSPAKRACHDETAPLVSPTAARRATPMLSASTLTHLIVNNALRRNFDAAALPPLGLLQEMREEMREEMRAAKIMPVAAAAGTEKEREIWG
jgi:hypothetical protein